MVNLKKIWQNKVFYVFVLLFLVFISPVTGRPAESELRAIVAAIGVDLHSKGVEVSAGVLSPKGEANIMGNLDYVSANGENINMALYNLGVKLGKKVGLSHCQYVVLGADLFEEDVTKYLDFFMRTNNLTSNSVLIATRGLAKDVIEAGTKNISPYNAVVRNMIIYNDDFLFTINMNIESFYNAYYGYEGISVLGVFDTISKGKEEDYEDGVDREGEQKAPVNNGDEEGEKGNQQGEGLDNNKTGQGESSGDVNLESGNADSENNKEQIESSGNGGGDEENSDEKVVRYQANMMIVKNGKRVRELNDREVLYLHLYHHYIRTLFIKIDDINMPEFKNASITFEVFDKRVDAGVYFINDIPVYKTTIKMNVKFDEINGEEQTIDSLNEVGDLLLPNVQEALNRKIESDFAEVIKNTKKYKTDILGIYTLFNKKHTKKWKEYINGLENQEDYLNGVVHELEVISETKL